MSKENYGVVRLKGAEIASVFDELAALRITVFKDYPYLYEGYVAYEKDYLRIYSRAERAFVAALYYNNEMVGATTCIPLSQETDELKKPFIENGFDLDNIFYFGESIILAAHRGHGFGHLFFDEREAHAKSFGTYTHTCFCSVDRGTSHPLRPADYRSNDAFWLKRGYRKVPSLRAEMEWPDTGQIESTAKSMIVWIREIDYRGPHEKKI